MTRQANVVTSMPVVSLSCGHEFSPFGYRIRTEDGEKDVRDLLERRADGWYAAHRCRQCKRPRAVVKVRLEVEQLTRTAG